MDSTARTAIARRAPSAPMRWLTDKDLLKGKKLDYGCGRGIDAQAFDMDGYDPHHPCWYESCEAPAPAGTYPSGTYDTVTSVYVLNVLPPRQRPAVVRNVRKLLKPGGKAYFVVRRDLSKLQAIPAGQYVVEMKLPLVYEKKGAFAIYCLEAD